MEEEEEGVMTIMQCQCNGTVSCSNLIFVCKNSCNKRHALRLVCNAHRAGEAGADREGRGRAGGGDKKGVGAGGSSLQNLHAMVVGVSHDDAPVAVDGDAAARLVELPVTRALAADGALPVACSRAADRAQVRPVNGTLARDCFDHPTRPGCPRGQTQRRHKDD